MTAVVYCEQLSREFACILSLVSSNIPPLLSPPFLSQLVFNPQRRIGVVEALEHPYLADLHAQVRTGQAAGRSPRLLSDASLHGLGALVCFCALRVRIHARCTPPKRSTDARNKWDENTPPTMCAVKIRSSGSEGEVKSSRNRNHNHNHVHIHIQGEQRMTHQITCPTSRLGRQCSTFSWWFESTRKWFHVQSMSG